MTQPFLTWLCLGTYLAAFREKDVLDSLSSLLNSIDSHNFKLLRVDRPRDKDGGIFIHFEYDQAPLREASDAVAEVIEAIRVKAAEAGGLPSWPGWGTSNVWVVRGEPWIEDMRRYAASAVQVEFEGPDVHPEALYGMFRPYGRIEDITRPQPAPAGTLRSSIVRFERVRSAVRAQNCMHGFTAPGAGASTRLSVVYEQAMKGRVIRDWLSNHPRIVLPIVAFLLGTLTYAIFDPFRSLMVQARMEGWFDYKDYRLVQSLRQATVQRLGAESSHAPGEGEKSGVVWEERKEAESTLEQYLIDVPSTIAFLHGPAGSGKSSLINHLLTKSDRPIIIIDCAAIYNANSDAAILHQIAAQTGYFPTFSGLTWVNNVMDLVSTGLIGQKSGFSKSLDEQLQDVLDVVGSALRRVNSGHTRRVQATKSREIAAERRSLEEAIRLERIRRGIFHDARLDCVSGNGVISELGIGDEMIGDVSEVQDAQEAGTTKHDNSMQNEKSRSEPPTNDISGLPIVILKNYDAKGAAKREAILNVLASWSAALIGNQIAHVIVASDNRESNKRLAKALGSRPLTTVALTDANATGALNIVSSRLDGVHPSASLSSSDTAQIGLLGGRSSDLSALVHKVKNGQTIPQAVDDIATRTMSELRKTIFGEDNEDAKVLPWGPEQAWSIVRKLASHSEVPYSDTLLNFPFKGDDAPLREMEKAELIAIVTDDGFPVSIRPGRPVYRHVFQRLVQDPLFSASQEVTINEKLITSAEATIKACEEELLRLRTIGLDAGQSIWHGKGATGRRADVLLRKMGQAVESIERLEKTNMRLKNVLAGGVIGRK